MEKFGTQFLRDHLLTRHMLVSANEDVRWKPLHDFLQDLVKTWASFVVSFPFIKTHTARVGESVRVEDSNKKNPNHKRKRDKAIDTGSETDDTCDDVSAEVLCPGDHINFYEPHCTAGEPNAHRTCEILSIVDKEYPLILSENFLLSRDNVIQKKTPNYDPEKWYKISSYELKFGGKAGHGTGVVRKAQYFCTVAGRIGQNIIRNTTQNGYCLRDVINFT